MTTATDTIHFVKYDTVDSKKPLLLFIQGSLPMPLIVDNNGYLDANHFSIFNKTVFNRFNVVEISQPNTPPVVNVENLNNQYAYVKSKNPYDYDKTYMKRNVVETYVERANEVIDCLIGENLVYSDSIYVYGHSQGAYVAARLASENETIKAIGFSSSSPFGRYAGIMQELRAEAIKGQITEDEAQQQIENYWNSWMYMVQSTNVPDNWSGDLPATWKSFSQSVVEILANLKQPVFVTYGTRDYHSLACELLPIYFGFANKTNYKMHPMPGRGHNFELINDDGKKIWNDSKWSDVMDEFVKFVKNER
ncbi:MAG: alpha/beta hydrolase [Prevotellaceae bacterium]|nr:alpha/beta hydrolase [Prevotellaceae bacterium]